jgi:diphthamide biosynthesis protein 2
MHSCEYPVYYVFDCLDLDVARVYEQLLLVDGHVLVYYDVGYHHAISQLEDKCPDRFIFTRIDTLVMPGQASEHKFSGRYYTLPDGVQVEDVAVFYIGPESLFASNLHMKYLSHTVIMYDPSVDKQVSMTSNRALMRRYALVQKARDADVIGIVVGTLGVGKSWGNAPRDT